MGNNIVKDYIEFISFCVSKLYEIDIVLKLDINRYREDSEVIEFKVMYENYKNLNIKLRYTATRYLPIGFEEYYIDTETLKQDFLYLYNKFKDKFLDDLDLGKVKLQLEDIKQLKNKIKFIEDKIKNIEKKLIGE